MTFRGIDGVHEHARLLYLGLASKNRDIAQEWIAALSTGDAGLYNFVEKHGDPSYVEPSEEEVKRLEQELEREFSKGKKC
jgi:hypothetical protein